MRADYATLLARIRDLSSELLPPANPTASYSDGEVLRMFAFRLSAHAEIEGFLEFCAETLIQDYSAKNNANRLSSRMQRTLLLHSRMVEKYPPHTLSTPVHPKKTAQQQVSAVLNVMQSQVDGNNGVSEKDVLKLLVPLGFDLAFFSLDWLGAMTALARARGEAAHTSWLRQGALQQPTPRSERQILARPLRGIGDVVRHADFLLRTA